MNNYLKDKSKQILGQGELKKWFVDYVAVKNYSFTKEEQAEIKEESKKGMIKDLSRFIINDLWNKTNETGRTFLINNCLNVTFDFLEGNSKKDIYLNHAFYLELIKELILIDHLNYSAA